MILNELNEYMKRADGFQPAAWRDGLTCSTSVCFQTVHQALLGHSILKFSCSMSGDAYKSVIKQKLQ